MRIWSLGICRFPSRSLFGSIFSVPPTKRNQWGAWRFGVLLLLLSVVGVSAQPAAINRVLELDGQDSYVEIPAGAFTNLTEVTVEG